MSGSTSPLGFPYLGPSDPPDIAGGLQSLAQSVQTYLLGPAWITLPLGTGVQANAGSGTTSGSYTPQYRVWGNGYVEYRGSVERTAGTAFGASTILFNIPTAALPACIVRCSMTGTVASTITENTRLELSPADGLCHLFAGTGDYFFVSLDDVRYYTT